MPNLKQLVQIAKILRELPMDEASRMARAKKMGFDVDTPVYHGTDATFSEFKVDPYRLGKTLGPGVYTTPDPKSASGYADYTGSSSGKQVYPLFLKGKPFDFSNPEHLKLLSKGNNKTFEDVLENYETLEHAAREVKKLGFDSARIKRDGWDEVVTFDPKNIRSKFARFDPENADSSNISAGLGTIGVGGLAAQQALRSQQPETEEERWNRTMSVLGRK